MHLQIKVLAPLLKYQEAHFCIIWLKMEKDVTENGSPVGLPISMGFSKGKDFAYCGAKSSHLQQTSFLKGFVVKEGQLEFIKITSSIKGAEIIQCIYFPKISSLFQLGPLNIYLHGIWTSFVSIQFLFQIFILAWIQSKFMTSLTNCVVFFVSFQLLGYTEK